MFNRIIVAIHDFFTVPVYARENVSLIYVSFINETISIDNGTSMEQAADVAFLPAPWPYCMAAGSIPIEVLLDEAWRAKMGPLAVVMDLCAIFGWFFSFPLLHLSHALASAQRLL